jgi:hypothetical protein
MDNEEPSLKPTYSYVIQAYVDTEGQWLDCEEGKYNRTPKNLTDALETIEEWATGVDSLNLRLVERAERVLLELLDEDNEDEEDNNLSL